MSCDPGNSTVNPQGLKIDWPFDFQSNRTSLDTVVPYHPIILNTNNGVRSNFKPERSSVHFFKLACKYFPDQNLNNRSVK